MKSEEINNSPRARILGNIRKSLGKAGPLSDEEVETLHQRQNNRPEMTRPALPEDTLSLFIEKMQGVQMTLERLSKSDGILLGIQNFIAKHGIEPRLCIAPKLLSVIPASACPTGWQVNTAAAKGDESVSITPCFAAVAETGSVVLITSPETPATLNFLPDNHIVVIYRDQVVPHIEDVWEKFKEAGYQENDFDNGKTIDCSSRVPRALFFNTGPSRTADIEQTVEIGAHGPRRMHVLLID